MHLGVPQHHLHGVHLTVLTLRWPLPILEPKGAHMDDILTMDEIRSHCDVEWVLVEDPELTPELKVVRGKVVWHSKERDEVYGKLLELRPKHAACLFTGPLPKDMEYVL